MKAIRKTARLFLLCLLLQGCVSQRYVGVQITSTEPMSITRIMTNGTAVVVCRTMD
ncbi:hypothetical protein [Lelliottia aquatilis]|uniref:hypothetical protein n=1 Tax=Lelliottia aquatilis TaxID=2080838 RepID=UPI0013FDCE20|nr:hypothetical protein [Lelliottia aquatilis]